MLIDGRSVYSPLYAGVFWSVQDVLLEDVERIEVIRGPGGTVWGANAVNGVINIITRHAKDTHGTYAMVGGGNVDHANSGFRYGWGNANTFGRWAYATGFLRGPESHAGLPDFDTWSTAQSGFRADWRPRGGDAVTLQGDLYGGVHGERVEIGVYSPPAQLVVNERNRLSGAAERSRAVAPHNRSGSDVQVQAYYDRTNPVGPNSRKHAARSTSIWSSISTG